MNAVDELNFLLGIGPPRPQLPITLQRSGYTAVRTLGKGSFGQALLVFHKGRQTYYVVKHVNMANMNSRQRKDAHNEISVLQQLHHPNIVRYEECFEEPPHLYIVMEHADGGDLFSHLAKLRRRRPFRSPLTAAGDVRGSGGGGASGWLSEAQVISLFVQTTMAVKHMHDRRLLHRDIKSQNVFLTKQHVVKLGDFGITTVLQNTVAMASTMCGTPCYFSPELCLGKPYNNKSDVWALGVLLYELCAGHVPFESTTMKSLMREIVNKEPPRIPSEFSEELWMLVQSMLRKDPRKRPDAGQVLHTPVLMQHVPDIIAQLEQAHSLSAEASTAPPPPSSSALSTDPSTGMAAVASPPSPGAAARGAGAPLLSPLQNNRRSSQANASEPRANGGETRQAEAASSPYYQLLQQQSSALSRGAGPGALPGRNPFASEALPASKRDDAALPTPPHVGDEVDPADAEEAYVAAYRRRVQEKQAQQQVPTPTPAVTATPNALSPAAPAKPATAEASSSSPSTSAAVAASKHAAPTLSPQLRAALSKGGKESSHAKDTPAPTPPSPPKRTTPAVPSAVTGAKERPSIGTLLSRFDQEKKRIQSEKQQQQQQQAQQQQSQTGQKSKGVRGEQAAQDKPTPAPSCVLKSGAGGVDAGLKKPRPLCVADQEELMSKQAAAAATNALDTLRTPGAAAARGEARASSPSSSFLPLGVPEGQVRNDTGAVPKSVQAPPPGNPPPASGVDAAGGGDLNTMMREMNAYFHNYQQRKKSDAAPGHTTPSPAASSSSAVPKSAAAAALGKPSSAHTDRPTAPVSVATKAAHTPASATAEVEEALFDDPKGACLDVKDIQQQHDHFWQHRQSGKAQPSSSSSTRASLRKVSPPTSSRVPAAGGASSKHASPGPASPTTPPQLLRPTTPHDVFMSSLNRKYQQPASVNAMAAASSPSQGASPRVSLGETPSPPPNAFLASTSGQPPPPSARAASDASEPLKSPLSALSAAGATTADGLPVPTFDLPFRGQCLCGAVQLTGWFSAIYGSFVCNCQACCRLSGSTLGIEWLHLPNASSMSDILATSEEQARRAREEASVTSDSATAAAARHRHHQHPSGSSVSGPAGSGVSAATALQQQQQQQQRSSHSPDREGIASLDRATRSYRFEMLIDVAEDDDDDDDGVASATLGSRGQQYVACFWTHFCSCCGTTIGFQHDGLDGVLLPKTILDEESEAVLRRFARTVAPDGEDDGEDDE